MQLVLWHKIMMVFALVFCLGFGIRALSQDEVELGTGFLMAFAGLGYYFRWFLRKSIRR